MADTFSTYQGGLESPVRSGFDAYAARSDTVDLGYDTRAIYTGSGGDLKVDLAGGSTVTFKAVPAGSLLPLRVRRLYATGTTITDCVGLF